MTAVARLWNAHNEAPFPRRLKYVDVAGVDMVTLDADVAGCVSSWLANGGNIDGQRWDWLAERESQLERMIPKLSDFEAAYCRRLLDMTVLVLDSSP